MHEPPNHTLLHWMTRIDERDIVKCCGSACLGQPPEQRLGVLQVLRVEAFGEPVVDGGEERAGLVALALIAEQAGQARRGSKLQGSRMLGASDLQRLFEPAPRLRFVGLILAETDLAERAMELGVPEGLLLGLGKGEDIRRPLLGLCESPDTSQHIGM